MALTLDIDNKGYKIIIHNDTVIVDLITTLAMLLSNGHSTVSIQKEFISYGDDDDNNLHEGHVTYFLHSEY